MASARDIVKLLAQPKWQPGDALGEPSWFKRAAPGPCADMVQALCELTRNEDKLENHIPAVGSRSFPDVLSTFAVRPTGLNVDSKASRLAVFFCQDIRVRKKEKRCQDPFFGSNFGRPRGRSVLARPSLPAVRLIHASLPKGWPRSRERRTASSSFSVSARFTCSSQFRGQGNGPSLSVGRASGFADVTSRCARLPQRHFSARFTRSARTALRSA